MFSKSESVSLFIACAHSLTSGGVVHVKVDLHLDSVQSRRGHIQQATYTSLKGEGEGEGGRDTFPFERMESAWAEDCQKMVQ